MTPWHAHIPTIRGKGRPRFSTRGGTPRAFTDPETRAAEKEVSILCRQARGRDPISGGWVVLGVIILDPIPASWRTSTGAPTLQARRAAWQSEPAAARPDVDNVAKLVGDGAAGVWFQGDAKVLPACWRGWTADPKWAGVHLYLWPAATPADALEVLSGPWLETVKGMMEPPSGWAPPQSSVSSSSL